MLMFNLMQVHRQIWLLPELYLMLEDTVSGMDLSNGGHLTHGSPVNFSGKLYNFVSYGVDKKQRK